MAKFIKTQPANFGNKFNSKLYEAARYRLAPHLAVQFVIRSTRGSPFLITITPTNSVRAPKFRLRLGRGKANTIYIPPPCPMATLMLLFKLKLQLKSRAIKIRDY